MESKRHFFVEFIGTFLLVFLGTGSIIISEEYGIIDGFGTGITFGLTVWLLIEIFGSFSDCHINPAVTLTMLLNKTISFKKGFFYIVLQFIGALLASILLQLLFPMNEKLGNTLPRGNWEEAFFYEFFLSFLLMLVILITTSKKLKIFAAFLIGLTVFFEAWLAGPICGASMNPARTFGPAIISGNIKYLALYLIAPVLGMFLAFYTLKLKNALN